MNEDVYAFALKSTLNEIKNVCPDISHSFIFGEGSKILAEDNDTTHENATQAATALTELIEKGDTIDGIESITFQTEKNRVALSRTSGLYSTIVNPKESDEKQACSLIHILIPTVLRLTEKLKESMPTGSEAEEPEPVEVAENDELPENPAEEETPSLEEEPESEPFVPEPMATQFMIENIGGLLVPTDTVQIDNAVILQWNEAYEDKEITEVEIETLSGQTTRCKFKPIKDSKHNGKGIIRMPKKVQLELQASKGELVMVKPVVE